MDLVTDQVVPWGYLLVFASAAAEAALFVGLVFPGESILLVAGFVAWRGDASLAAFIALAIAGAVAGDSVGYEIGRHLGPRLRRSRLGQRLGDDRWERAERYLDRKGGKAVFLARWVTVVRAVVPALAGQARMPYRRFLAWNVAGAVPWGITVVGAGYAAGESYESVERYVGIGGYALLALATVVVAVVLVRRHRRRVRDGAAVTA